MLIPQHTVINLLKEKGLAITGVFHIGAFECEELEFYQKLGLSPTDVVWIDAVNDKVIQAKERGIPNVFNAVITDKDDEIVTFNVSNNIASSSILDLCTHKIEHPHIFYTNSFTAKSITVASFFEKNNIDSSKLNFWNFDIQGAELLALKGAEKYLHKVDVIYLEVNIKELYKGCAMMSDIDLYLADFGFIRVITEMTRYSWGDAVYIKK
jgi:FkbM family methyltransferase|uniref:Methyltransferase FkbM domain-containing protein n=1 Tax=viral metagenome TaxID=1070528 RepID=A0A6C0CZ77_9ZZZZ